jgi:hypothetical protein
MSRSTFGNPAQVENQKTVQKVSQFLDLGFAWLQSRHRGPIPNGKRTGNLPRPRSQFAFRQVRGQAEFVEQFDFKGKQRLGLRCLFGQMGQQGP